MWKLTAQGDADALPFGKHKGRPLREVPTDYLLWLWRRVPLRPDLRARVRRQLTGRHSAEAWKRHFLDNRWAEDVP